MATLGQISLYIASIISSISILLVFYAIKSGNHKFLKSGEKSLVGASYLIVISIFILTYSFVTNDYTIKYVAHYSDSTMPFFYKLAAVWGGQPGSMLLWAAILSIFIIILFIRYPKDEKTFYPHVIWLLAVSNLFFIMLILFESNPFETFATISQIPPDGAGLNPQLQTFSMLFHPPFLYLGFVGFNIVIVFALAALITDKLDGSWLIYSRKWTIYSWAFLMVGNILGAAWAYTELGWGGFWAWDPVENASFIPWLTATALLHSANIEKTKKIFKIWNISLAIITFGLTILGTFITRSGFIDSVHAFAKSSIGWYFIVFLIIFIIFSVVLMIIRRKSLVTDFKIESFFSKEAMFLFANILFMIGVVIILFGTLAPNISQAMGHKISINQTFFNQVFSPVGLLILLLMGLAPALAWKKTSRVVPHIVIMFLLGVIIVLISPNMLSSKYKLYSLFSILFSVLNVTVIIQEFYLGIKYSPKTLSKLGKFIWLFKKKSATYGGFLIHIGVIFLFIGLAGVAFKVEGAKLLNVGDSFTLGEYQIKFNKIYTNTDDIAKDMVVTDVDISIKGKKITELHPYRNYYNNSIEGATSEVAIYSTLGGDLYLVLEGFDIEKDMAFIRAYINPLMIWLWLGGFMMLFGSIILLLYKKS